MTTSEWESGGEHARSPDASRGFEAFGIRDSVWSAGGFSAAFAAAGNE